MEGDLTLAMKKKPIKDAWNFNQRRFKKKLQLDLGRKYIYKRSKRHQNVLSMENYFEANKQTLVAFKIYFKINQKKFQKSLKSRGNPKSPKEKIKRKQEFQILQILISWVDQWAWKLVKMSKRDQNQIKPNLKTIMQ